MTLRHGGKVFIATLPVIVLLQFAYYSTLGQAVQTHPRLWIRNSDITALKAKANSSNPYFVSFKNFVSVLKTEMDAGRIPNQYDGTYSDYSQYPTETTAMVFAFMSLITDGAESQDYASRAKTLVMHIINLANQGVANDQPFRDNSYSTYDRSRWYFFGIPLAVDWAYPQFSDVDKAKIRSVFLRWCNENTNANTTTDNHPEPVGVRLDPALLQDHDSDARSRRRIRYSSNNYYLGHLRNLFLMAASLDNSDDPDGQLHKYMDDVTGAWLYVTEEYLKNEGKGGLSAEGFLYGPSAYGRLAQTLLAIYTSGEAEPQNPMRGVRSTFNMSFWDEIVPANLHSISPQSTTNHPWTGEGSYFLPLNYGDIQKFRVDDYNDLLGVIGWYDKINGNNPNRLNMIKWMQTNIPVGGKSNLVNRVRGNGGFFELSIFYFLLFDPSDNPVDPTPSLSNTWYSEGIGRILSRTDWTPNATAFTFKCGFSRIDHQFADAMSFSLYRKGAFLTSPLNGYGFDMAVSPSQNSLSLQNNLCDDGGGPLSFAYGQGSQWFLASETDGKITSWSDNDKYLQTTGDATGLYTYINPYVNPTGNDITHASRSIVWLKPDQLIIYDRATSKTAGRYKRFWMGLPSPATINSKTATSVAPNNQVLHISNLLPANATLTAQPYGQYNEPAENDPMKARLMIEDTSNPVNVRFLNVLQGRDAAQTPLATSLVTSDDNSFQGSAVGNIVVMFKRDLASSFQNFAFTAPSIVNSYLITGLSPSSGYNLQVTDQPDGTHRIVVSSGTDLTSDKGGALIYNITPTADVACFTYSATNRDVQFTTCSTGVSSYQWDFGDGSTSVSSNPVHTYAVDGTYTVKLTTGTSSISKQVTISSFAACFTFSVSGKSTQFTNCSSGGDSYAWDFGDNVTSSLLNPTHTYVANGTYSVKLTIGKSTGETTSVSKNVTIGDGLITGVENKNEQGVTIFPNPASNIITVQAGEQIVEIVIQDLNGGIITQKNAVDSNESVIDTEGLGHGLYLVKIKTENNVSIRKVVIR